MSQTILHLLTFSILQLLSHQCKGSDKNFCQSLDHGRIATKRDRATRHISKGYGSVDADGHVSSAFCFLPAPLRNEWCTAKVVDGYLAIAGAHTHSRKLLLGNLPLPHVIASGQTDQGAVLMAAKRVEEIGGELRFLGV